MSDRSQIARATAAGLRRFASHLARSPLVIGFDGFVDSIIRVVETRYDADRFDEVPTIAKFGQKVINAAGMSSNYELFVRLEKLGGNGPIMAMALAQMGFPVTYIGALGQPAIHHVFEPLVTTATCISISNPGFTDALEFSDGKLMLGKNGALKNVNWGQLEKVVGREKLRQLLSQASLIGMVNWTMLPHLGEIWKHLIDLTGELPPPPHESGRSRRAIFIDLADPEKRTAQDLRGALEQCTAFERHADVTLGLNWKEATTAAQVLGIPVGADAQAQIESLAKAFVEKLAIHAVVIHPRTGAAAARREGGLIASAQFAGPFVAEPKLSTGAGDNFNAGFCLGSLAGLPLEQALCTGVATSGYYVRQAASPTLEQLAAFCDELPAPQPHDPLA